MIEIKLNRDELARLIKDMPEMNDAAIRATAFQVEGLAKAASPYMTGANRNSIYTKTSKGMHGNPGEAGDVLPDVEQGEAVVGPSMEYSARLEFGFVGTDALGRHYHQAPRPYLYPALGQAPMFFEQAIKGMLK